MDSVIKGRCYCCGDSMTVYQIIPENRWTMNRIDLEEMSRWVFETVEPGVLQAPGWFKQLGLDIVVAGLDFGCGSKSVEHPMAALMGAGVKLVIAESFSRYSYRNALNLGLPVLVCPGISSAATRGDILAADLLTGEIRNLTTGECRQAEGLGEFAFDIISAGGLIAYIEQKNRR